LVNIFGDDINNDEIGSFLSQRHSVALQKHWNNLLHCFHILPWFLCYAIRHFTSSIDSINYSQLLTHKSTRRSNARMFISVSRHLLVVYLPFVVSYSIIPVVTITEMFIPSSQP